VKTTTYVPPEGANVQPEGVKTARATAKKPNGPAGGTRKLAFPIIAWKDIADLEEEWRVDEVFPLIGLGCIYGGPSTVKTFILLDLLAHVARGGFWGGREVKQCPVVYIAAEGSGGIRKRIAGIKKVHADKGLSPDIPFHLITVAPNLGMGVGDLEKLIESLEALGIVPGVIAIDTASRSLGGADENGPGMDQLVNNGTALANYFSASSCLFIIRRSPMTSVCVAAQLLSAGSMFRLSASVKRAPWSRRCASRKCATKTMSNRSRFILNASF
jgi:hypothetical protein